ncbi:DUF1553 domain-containing protein [bacterium]|nr:DUF1553 domain-containing protein [bacterium]
MPVRPLAAVCSFVLVLFNTSVLPAADSPASRIVVQPAAISLKGQGAGAQVVLTVTENGRQIDLTREAELEWLGAGNVVQIDDHRMISAMGDGQGELRVRLRSLDQRIPVTVTGVTVPPPVDFDQEVQPVLTKFSCNAGTCHGKQRGQNGFQLSLLGFDSDFDFDALVKEGRGRRTSATVPVSSLLLQKPCGGVPHGGGVRITKDSPAYDLLERWIADGLPRRIDNTPVVLSVAVFPSEVVLGRESRHQLRVVATYSDGSERDVTQWASFQSSDAPIAEVDERGLITAGSILGDAAIMARFQGQITVASVLVPHPQPAEAAQYANLPIPTYIDGLVWKRLQKLGITPSAEAPEATVLRRLYLDIIGRGPTAEEARSYLDSTASDKRSQLIDSLLQHPEYAEHWASKWADLLRPNPYHVGIKATLNYDQWIRQAFRRNMPYDQFVRELVTAQGSTFRHGNATLYRNRRTPDELTTQISQLFLGVRLECAKCHQHPFEVYSQRDFYSFAAFFARVGRKGTGISAPISGSEEFIFVADKGSVSHPLTGETLTPKPLKGEPLEIAVGADPREALVDWMTAAENPYFSRVIANRVWADLMGRGLVEPVDDLRGTNPPSNPELLDALADDLKSHGYDLKHLIRSITNSQVYALSSVPSETNAADHRNFSRHYRQRLRAETLYDTLTQITGDADRFDAMPADSRAKELWTVRVDSLFLDAFSRQDPNQDPPCERNTEPTIVQALHLMNSKDLYQRVTAKDGRAADLAERELSPEQIVEEVYLAVYGRRPSADELSIAVTDFPTDPKDRRVLIEDLMWALINTAEFVFED